MTLILYKIIVLGIPILVLVLGLGFVVWSVINGRRQSKLAKKTVSGYIFKHPDNGGGGEVRLYDKKLTRPQLQPDWYRRSWLSPQVPFYWFYEDKVEEKPEIPVQMFKCLCGYEATNRLQLHAHCMWTPKRKLAKEAWLKIHAKVETPVVAQSQPTISYIIKPYDVDTETREPYISAYGVYDMNNWNCHRGLMRKLRGKDIKGLVNMVAGTVLAIACLVLSFAIVSDKSRQAPPEPAEVEVTK